MQVTNNISLDFGRAANPPTVYAKQGDISTRYIRITPMLGGNSWTIPDGVSVHFAARKPDGKHVFNEQTVSDGYIIVELTDQTLVVAGKSICDVILTTDDGKILSSQNFFLEVEYSPGVYAELESTDEVQTLWNLIETLETKLASGEFVGEKGESGKDGEPGKDGKSAYEYAVDGGYDGSEEEFYGDLANAGKGGGADLSDSLPLMDGDASAGAAETAARADHVHPTDTTRMPGISLMSSLLTPDKSDRFPVYDYDAGSMKYVSWTRILSLTKANVDRVASAGFADAALGLQSLDGLHYATLPNDMTEDGVIALVSDLAALPTEEWVFELEDGTTVTKQVMVR